MTGFAFVIFPFLAGAYIGWKGREMKAGVFKFFNFKKN